MPGQNSLTDQGIKSLVDENFPFLTKLQISNNRKLTPKHLEYLAQVNSSKWTHLQMSHNSVFETTLQTFFQNKSFDNLKSLKLLGADDAFRFFEFFPWKSMSKLEYLDLWDTDFSWSVSNVKEDGVQFPSLKGWTFGGNWMSKRDLDVLVSNLTHFGPQLQLVNIHSSNLNQDTHYLNISSLSFDTIPRDIYIYNVDFLTIHKPHNGSKLEVLTMVYGKDIVNFFKNNFHYSFFGVYSEFDVNYHQKFLQSPELINKVVEHLKKIVSFDKLENIEFSRLDDLKFFKRLFFKENQKLYVNQYRKFIESGVDIKSSVYMPYLRQINYMTALNQTQECPFLYYFNKMEMPLLREIFIGKQIHKELIRFLRRLFDRQNNIYRLNLLGNKLNCEKLSRLFENVTFPFLSKLFLGENQIEHDCLKDVISKHKLVRQLQLSGNFLETGVFEEILAKHQLMLKYLQFSNIQIGNEEFSKLSKINSEFLQTLTIQRIAINSEGIVWLVGNNTWGWLFPRCMQINLGQNSINETGVEALLGTGMPFLKHIKFYRVTNPNLVNNLLYYPNQFVYINLESEVVYGLREDLDPRSTRHVTSIDIKSKSLTLEDYQVLSQMDFINLIEVALQIQNIYECQILKYVLKIAQNSKMFSLMVQNQKIKDKIMDDKCLQKHNPTQIYMKHLNLFNIAWIGISVYVPKFYTYLYSQNQLVSVLSLAYCLIGDEAFLTILQNCNLQHLWMALLIDNLLTDESVAKFFDRQLKILKILELRQNLFGSEALKTVVGREFNELMSLGLHRNRIDDKGIYYLTKAAFPKLVELALDGNDITKEGFLKIFYLNAPKLLAVSVQNILMTEDDLIWALERVEIDKLPFLMMIQTNIRMGPKNVLRLNKLIEKLKIKRPAFIITYEQFYLENINKAII